MHMRALCVIAALSPACLQVSTTNADLLKAGWFPCACCAVAHFCQHPLCCRLCRDMNKAYEEHAQLAEQLASAESSASAAQHRLQQLEETLQQV